MLKDPGLTSPPRVGCCHDVRLPPHRVPSSSGSHSPARAVVDAVAIVSADLPQPLAQQLSTSMPFLPCLLSWVFCRFLKPKFLCPTMLR